MSNPHARRSASTYVLNDTAPLYVTWAGIRRAALAVTGGDIMAARSVLKKSSNFSDEKISKIIP